MAKTSDKRFSIQLGAEQQVSAIARMPAAATSCFVFAHGAGAGMDHPFMEAFSAGLAERRVGTLRYQFPFMENGSKRADTPSVADAAVRAAVAEAGRRFSGMLLFAGGKSFGGRMTSQAQAADPLDGVIGLIFVGFPLHPAGTPSQDRAKHLLEVTTPMLFIQGTRDKLADESLVRSVVQGLGKRATLEVVDGADHSFHVLVRSGRTAEEVLAQVLNTVAKWMGQVASARVSG